MKSSDLRALSRTATQALKVLNRVAASIRDQDFLSLEEEAQCTYLASVKSGIYITTNALLDLTRRCDSAVGLWKMVEASKNKRDLFDFAGLQHASLGWSDEDDWDHWYSSKSIDPLDDDDDDDEHEVDDDDDDEHEPDDDDDFDIDEDVGL